MSSEDNNPYQTPQADLSVPEEKVGSLDVTGIKKMPAKRGWKWITQGYGLFKEKAGVWILIVLIYFVLAIATAVIPVIGQYIQAFINPVLVAGIMLGCLALHQQKDFGVGHLFKGFQILHVRRLLVLGLIALAIAVISTLSMEFATKKIFGIEGGFEGMLLAGNIGAEYWLLMLFWMLVSVPILMFLYFAPTLIALGDMTVPDALVSSFKGCLKNILPFLVYSVMAILLFIPAAIPLGLGFLVLLPVLIISMYFSYIEIYTDHGNIHIS